MSGGGPVPTSSLREASSAGSASGTSGVGSSAISEVEQLRSELGAEQTSRGTVVALPGDVLFDFDKSEIRASARPTLDKVAQLIAADDAKSVAIEGHTDSKGDDSYNQRLSERRAQAVRDYLKDVRGIAADRMSVKGYGENRPVSQNMTPDGKENEAGMQENRRVEVVIGDG